MFMDDEIGHDFGHAPICPSGMVPVRKLNVEREEKREYREMWQKEKQRREKVEETIKNLLEFSSYWIERGRLHNCSEDEYRCWLALGYHSKTFTEATEILNNDEHYS